MAFSVVRGACAGCAAAFCVAVQAPAQSVLDRPPNLSAGWVGAPGTLHFNFLHRFDVSGPPLRKVTNSPTFLLAYGVRGFALVGAHYATSSDVVPGVPNEWEFFARGAPLAEVRGAPLDLSVQLGYNPAAESADGELALARTAGRARFVAAARAFSDGYGSGDARWAVAGGLVVRVHRYASLAADVGALGDREPGEEVAWGAALQVAIPYTPHTLSLQVTNASTGTLQGSSRGRDRVRFGFEFTVPITLRRYVGGGTAAATEPAGPPAGVPEGGLVRARIRNLAFGPARIEVVAGTTVEWTNEDPVAHTVTADEGAFDSGLLEPGAVWRRRFEVPGEYPFHCTPHPFMRGVVVVRAAGGGP